MERRLFVFDMDGTLIRNTTGLLELAKVLGTENELIEMENRFSKKELSTYDFTQEISQLWGMISEAVSIKAFKNTKKIKGISKCLKSIKNDGNISCLITMSQDIYARHFSDYGFDYIYSSLYPPNSGKNNIILTPEDKLKISRYICTENSLDFSKTVAFGDSMSDKYLFSALINTIAVNASEEIRAISKYYYDGGSIYDAYKMLEF